MNALSLARRVLPRGSGAVGGWLLVSGLGAYGFLTVAAKAIGSDEYGALSALWGLGFLVSTGCFLPVEQELSRALSDRNARGLGGAPVVRKAAVAAGVVAATLTVVVLAASVPLLDDVFDGQILLLVGLVLMIWSYALEHTTRGVLAGNGRFEPYGRLLGVEATARFVAAAILAAAGVEVAGPYGIVLGLGAFVGVGASLFRQRDLLSAGPPASWRELSRAVGWLLGASLLTQTLVNAGPVLVQILAGPGEGDLAGRYLACLVVARVPVFFFQAVQASLVPELATIAASGDHIRVRAGLRRLVLALAALGVVATVGAALLGPEVVELAFGPEFVLPREDLALLAAGAAVFLVALTLAQGLIALARPARAAAGFAAGVVVLAALVPALGGSIVTRVALATLVGSVAAALALGVLLAAPLRRALDSGTRSEAQPSIGSIIPDTP